MVVGCSWVICMAESYSKFNTDTADLLPIKIELMYYRLSESNMLTLDTESYQKIKLQDLPKLGTTIEKKTEPLHSRRFLAKSMPASRKLFDNLKSGYSVSFKRWSSNSRSAMRHPK